MVTVFLVPAFVVLIFFILAFLYSLFKKNNSVADIAWGMGFILATATSLIFSQNTNLRALIVAFLVLLWGIRLTLHIFLRNKGKPEDFRYKEWREQWGKQVIIKSFFRVYLLQWLLMQCIVSSSVVITTYSSGPLTILDGIGMCLWITGFFFETVGDWQLMNFKKDKDNRGKIMMEGLWKYTRHPNYFGEVVQWWGIYIIALSVPFGAYTILSPLTITYLILKVSGIPLLEKKYAGNLEFEVYKRRTSPFFPLPPKKEDRKEVL